MNREIIFCVSMQGPLPQDAWPLAECMAASIRHWMPHARIAQHTDLTYPALPWADEVRRTVFPGDIIDQRWSQMTEHTMARPEANLIQLDCDVVLRDDVTDVFDMDFDIAMCRTPDRRDRVFNAGVIFQKPSGASFWREVVREYQDPRIRDGWEGSQTAITRAADRVLREGMKILELPFDVYNYTPDAAGEAPGTARLVHYRGRRKRFMIQDNPQYMKEAA